MCCVSVPLLPGSVLQTSGTVMYNKQPLNSFIVERTAAFIDQHDVHLPVLTVGETLSFAHACAGARPDFISKQAVKDA